MDKVFSWPTWLNVQMDCIEVRFVEAYKRTYAKVVGHHVIKNPQLTQQLHVTVEVIDDCMSSECMMAWRKCSDINLCEPKHTKLQRVAQNKLQPWQIYRSHEVPYKFVQVGLGYSNNHSNSNFFPNEPYARHTFPSGGSLLVLCNHVHVTGIFMGAIYLLIWVVRNPLRWKTNNFTKYSTPYR